MSPGTIELTARWTEAGVCAASAPGSKVSHKWESRRTRPAPRARGRKAKAKRVASLRRASGLAPPQLRVATLGLVLGRVAPRHRARLAPGRRWRGLRARRALGSPRLDLRATLRLAGLDSWRAHVGAHRLGGAIRPIAAVRLVPALSSVAAVRSARVPARDVRTVARRGNDPDAP